MAEDGDTANSMCAKGGLGEHKLRSLPCGVKYYIQYPLASVTDELRSL